MALTAVALLGCAKTGFHPLEGKVMTVSAGTDRSVSVGDTVTFTSLVRGGRFPLSFRWSFGDDGTSTDAVAAHVFKAAGKYPVDLWVADSRGQNAHSSVSVTVGPAGDGGGGPLPAEKHGLPLTVDGIHLFSDQLPHLSDAMVRFVATHYAGAQKLTKDENDRFRAINPSWLLLHYRLGSSSGVVPYIHGGTWSNDFASDVDPHEDWFMHNSGGKRHHDPVDDWYLNDVTSPGFRGYWVSSVIADMRATGAQGVFADSFEAGVSGFGVTLPDPRFEGTGPGNPALWEGGINWFMRLKGWADYIESAFSGTPEKFLFIPNIGALITSWESMDYSSIDGCLLEGFGMVTTTDDWLLGMRRALPLVRADKIVIQQSYPSSFQSRQFLLGTYLLLKGNYTYVNLGGSGVHYFPEYQMDLGPARSPPPADPSAYAWQGIYRRDFGKGFVLVNPSPDPVQVSLDRDSSRIVASGGGDMTDTDLDGSGAYRGGSLGLTVTRSLTMPAWSAAFFSIL